MRSSPLVFVRKVRGGVPAKDATQFFILVFFSNSRGEERAEKPLETRNQSHPELFFFRPKTTVRSHLFPPRIRKKKLRRIVRGNSAADLAHENQGGDRILGEPLTFFFWFFVDILRVSRDFSARCSPLEFEKKKICVASFANTAADLAEKFASHLLGPGTPPADLFLRTVKADQGGGPNFWPGPLTVLPEGPVRAFFCTLTVREAEARGEERGGHPRSSKKNVASHTHGC